MLDTEPLHKKRGALGDMRSPLRKRKSESTKAFQALTDYCQMGTGRAVHLLVDKYTQDDIRANIDGLQNERPPTKSRHTLENWSTKFEWVNRADRWDEAVRDEKAAIIRKQNEKAFSGRFASMSGRLIALNRLACFLEDQVYAPDEDGIIPFRRFVIREFRDTMGDIADEVGERTGSPVDVVNWSPEEWKKEASKRMSQADESLSVLDLLPEEGDDAS